MRRGAVLETVGERGAEDSFILLMLSRPQDGDGEALPKEEVGRGFPHICVCLLDRLFVRHILLHVINDSVSII